MRRNFVPTILLAVCAFGPGALAQNAHTASPEVTDETALLPDAPTPSQQSQLPSQDRKTPPPQDAYNGGRQTKRILGIIPNFRSVSVDEKLPPISKHDKFKLMLDDNFDYSNFIYVGIIAGVGQAENSYPEFHHGVAAFGRYYWHSYADTFDGNLMTEFLIPVATKEDPRYYTLGRGGFLKRAGYSVSRLLITRSDSGNSAPNISEIIGNGAASGISDLYYPQPERTWTKTGQRWITQIGLDGASNLIKEFWPDINSMLFHGHY